MQVYHGESWYMKVQAVQPQGVGLKVTLTRSYRYLDAAMFKCQTDVPAI